MAAGRLSNFVKERPMTNNNRTNQKVLFISNQWTELLDLKNQSVRYRCFYTKLCLSNNIEKVDTCTIHSLINNVDLGYDVYIFHSPIATASTKRLFEKLKKHKKFLIADYDDLILDKNFATLSFYNFHHSAENSESYALSMIEKHIEAAQMMDAIICSTQELKKQISLIFATKRIDVIGFHIPSQVQNVMRAWRQRKRDFVIFSAGSRSNIASIMAGIRSLKETQFIKKQVLIAGSFDQSEKTELKEKFGTGVQFTGKLSYYNYCKTLSSAHLLINCHLQNPVNLCKAKTKLLEANLLGTHVVSSFNQDYEEGIKLGLSGEILFNNQIEASVFEKAYLKLSNNVDEVLRKNFSEKKFFDQFRKVIAK